MAMWLKHLVTCRCVLPQFKRNPNPPQHQFVVFSVIEDDNLVKPKLAQCNNCGSIHRVTEINRSQVLAGRDDMSSILKVDDIKPSLPARLVEALETNNADLPTWEAVKYIYDNKRWGEFVVLTTDVADEFRIGKYVVIVGENLFKVETFEREEVTQ